MSDELLDPAAAIAAAAAAALSPVPRRSRVAESAAKVNGTKPVGSIDVKIPRVVVPVPAESVDDMWAAGVPESEDGGLPHGSVGGVPGAAVRTRRIRTRAASTIRPVRVKWLWEERIPIGEITLVPGREGVGKSTFLAWLAAQVTRCCLVGEYFGQEKHVLYAAVEDSWESTIVPRMIAARVDLDRVHQVEVETDAGGVEGLCLPVDCAELAELALEMNVGMLLLDPVISSLHSELNVNKTSDVRRALEPLKRAAERGRFAVVGLMHYNKSSEGDANTRISGSRAFAEVARAVIAIAKNDSDDEKDPLYGANIVSQTKNNLGRGDLPSLAYVIESYTVETDDGDMRVGRAEMISNVQVTKGADEILTGQKSAKARPKSKLTVDLLALVEGTEGGLSTAEAVKCFPGVKAGTIRQTLARLHNAKEIARTAYGTYVPVGLPQQAMFDTPDRGSVTQVEDDHGPTYDGRYGE